MRRPTCILCSLCCHVLLFLCNPAIGMLVSLAWLCECGTNVPRRRPSTFECLCSATSLWKCRIPMPVSSLTVRRQHLVSLAFPIRSGTVLKTVPVASLTMFRFSNSVSYRCTKSGWLADALRDCMDSSHTLWFARMGHIVVPFKNVKLELKLA